MFFFGKSNPNKIKDKLKKNRVQTFELKDIFSDSRLIELLSKQLNLINKREKITLEDLEKIEVLDASNLGIKSLEGIEFLNNLKVADFSNNNISKLPNYTDNNPNLFNNKNTIIYFDLENNPFLNETNLFSLDATTSRNNFFNQFADKNSRFHLGSIQNKVFTKEEINPYLVRAVIENLVPNSLDKDKEVNEIFLKYIIGKKIFHNEEVYKNNYIVNNNTLKFSNNIIEPNYVNINKELLNQLTEKIIPEEDLYLIRSLINSKSILPELNSNNINDYIDYYSKIPEFLSKDYILVNNKWVEKLDYKELKKSTITTEEEKILNEIQNKQIKTIYNNYLNYKDILEKYKRDHPEKNEEINKIIRKNEEFILNFLKQYIQLENNILLNENQSERLAKSEEALEKFINNYSNQIRSLLEQDVFNLEVEMRYIDMLTEADRRFKNE